MCIPLFFVLSLGLTVPALAQTTPAPDTARTYKHQLGLTASPQLDQFFTANRSLPVGVIYRRQTQPNRTTRYRAVGRYAYDRTESPLFLGTAYSQHTASLELALGRERWLPISRRFTAYGGIEGGAYFSLSRKAYKIYHNGFPIYTPGYPPTLGTAVDEGTENWGEQGVFAQVLAGLRFQVSKRFAAEL